jgi:arginine decarboxylase-like protein
MTDQFSLNLDEPKIEAIIESDETNQIVEPEIINEAAPISTSGNPVIVEEIVEDTNVSNTTTTVVEINEESEDQKVVIEESKAKAQEHKAEETLEATNTEDNKDLILKNLKTKVYLKDTSNTHEVTQETEGFFINGKPLLTKEHINELPESHQDTEIYSALSGLIKKGTDLFHNDIIVFKGVQFASVSGTHLVLAV